MCLSNSGCRTTSPRICPPRARPSLSRILRRRYVEYLVVLNKMEWTFLPPPRLLLRSWERLSKLLVTFYPGVPLHGTRIDLKNAFWSFVQPESARTLFRLQSGSGGRVVGLGRLPFGWKYSPYICRQALAHPVEQALPRDILLVHYLDNFLLVHHDRGYLRQHTGGVVVALERGGVHSQPQECAGALYQACLPREMARSVGEDGMVT